jgi:hypothetical protein
MAHKVREMTIRLVVDDDGPMLDSIGEVLIEGNYPDWLVSFEAVIEEQRDATEDEAGSMLWDTDD